MRVTGYQIREAINRWSLRKTTIYKQFNESIWAFAGEEKQKPQEVVQIMETANRSWARLKEIQQFYNRTVSITFKGQSISLCLAVQMLPGVGQIEKMYRDASTDTGRDRYSGYREIQQRSKDTEYASRQITMKDALAKAEESSRSASSLRNAIARANTQEIEIGTKGTIEITQEEYTLLFE
jgi:hypothetical protein